jgi:hypothetical protein
MTEQDLELLSQFLDGELPSPQARALRERLLAEPELRSELERMKAVDARLRRAFGETGEVPPGVAALLEDCEAGDTAAHPGHGRRWGFAIAASVLAAAVFLASPEWRQQQPAGDTALARALESVPSSSDAWTALGDDRLVRPMLSFQSHAGGWCREYLLQQGNDSWHGVACREGESRWTNELLVPEAAAAASGDYRPAGAGDAGAIADFVNQHAADIPVSAAEEAGLIARGWQ